MKARVLKTPRAKQDLIAIFAYIDARSPRAADRFLEAAETSFANLAEMPGMGHPWISPDPQLSGIRVWAIPGFRKYLIFYRPIESGVEVLHVLHGARDIPAILEEDL